MMQAAVASSRDLERSMLGQRLEAAAGAALPGQSRFVRVRSPRTGEPDAAAVKARLERETGGPVRVAPLDTFLRCRGSEGVHGVPLRRLERMLRAGLMRARAYYAVDAVYLLGFSPIAGVAGLRVTESQVSARARRRGGPVAGTP
jgi:hypothetical protein